MIITLIGHGSRSPARPYWPRRIFAFCALLLLLGSTTPTAWLQGQSKGVGAPRSVNMRNIKREIQFFERILDLRLSQIPNAMLAVVDRAKGVYLEGYGIVFTSLVNINRVIITTPFGKRPMGKQQTAEEKRKWREEIREILIRTLQTDSGPFRSLAPGDAIVIAVHFEDSNELDDAKRNTTIVLKVLKQDLEAYKTKGYEEFKKRVIKNDY